MTKDTNHLDDSLDSQAERFLRQHYTGDELRENGILSYRRQKKVATWEYSLEGIKESMSKANE